MELFKQYLVSTNSICWKNNCIEYSKQR